MLRPYQQAAFDAAISWIKKSVEPVVVEAATGAGKSHIIASIAHWVETNVKKKVLVIQPSKELVEQNHAKYLMTGNPASIFCASIKKQLKHTVTFGTPKTIANSIGSFGEIALVIIDECDCITPTVQNIIKSLRTKNDKLRVIGLTATPYRTQSGYIYQYGLDGEVISTFETRDPYYHKLIYRITARELIAAGYLTHPTTDATYNDNYDTSGLHLNKMGNYDAAEVEKTFVGRGRKTSKIVEDIVKKCRNRKGVMIFAASRNHAAEIMESLPKSARSIDGTTKKKEREESIRAFKNQEFKYIVSIGTLTTGFDAPHVDAIAILRLTESARLLQQIIGRGLRLHPGKEDALTLDYARNFERHFPDGDIFNPEIKAKKLSEGFEVQASCAACGFDNIFGGRPNPDGFDVDKEGYFLDLRGQRITVDEGKPLPAHFGRRCMGFTLIKGVVQQCNQRWSFKGCPECNAENDIAARNCIKCKAELVDPNEKLKLEYAKLKKDPYTPTEDLVLGWLVKAHTSAKGNLTLKIIWQTECRKTTVYYMPQKTKIWENLCLAVFEQLKEGVEDFVKDLKKNGKMPESLIAAKSKSTGFYHVYEHKRIRGAIPGAVSG